MLFNFQNHGLFKAKESRNPFSIGAAEKKLLIVLSYYLVIFVLGFLAFTLTKRSEVLLQEKLQRYFMCESQGHNPDNPCDRSQFEQLNYSTAITLSLSILLLAPVVNFVFIFNIRLLKEKLTTFRNIIQAQFARFFQ